jgi:hypothetical protein
MTALSAFGLFAVTTMLICYAFEDRDPLFIWHRDQNVTPSCS